ETDKTYFGHPIVPPNFPCKSMCVLLVAFVGGSPTVLPHLFEVRLHRLARLLSVALLHRVENPLVMNLAALGTARHFENSQALFPQQSHDRIDQGKDQRIR